MVFFIFFVIFRYDIHGGGLRVGNNPFLVQTSVVVVEQRVLFRGHTVRHDRKFVVPVADRQRDIFRFHRRHVDPLGRLSARKPCVADQIPSQLLRGQEFAETDISEKRSGLFFHFDNLIVSLAHVFATFNAASPYYCRTPPP